VIGAIFDSKVVKRLDELLAKRIGRIMLTRPPGGCQKLISRRRQETEVSHVLAARTLIYTGVQLEMNLIQAACDMKHERAVSATNGPLREAVREPEPQQVGRTGVEPSLSQSERIADIANGFDECIRQRLRGRIPTILNESDHVEIVRRPRGQTEE